MDDAGSASALPNRQLPKVLAVDDEDFEREVHRKLAEMPRVPGIDWNMALTTAMLRILENRLPGFRDEVRARLQITAERLENSGNPEDKADAPSLRELLESWVFTEDASSDDSEQR